MGNIELGLDINSAKDSKMVNAIHLVSFFLADEEYGINLKHVKEIINIGRITPVPHTPSHIKGIINLRGNVISVMDLRLKFNLITNDISEKSRIIVVERKTRTTGLLVDAVSEVLHIPFDLLEPAPDSKRIKKEFLKGVVNMEDRLIILLDVDRIMQFEL